MKFIYLFTVVCYSLILIIVAICYGIVHLVFTLLFACVYTASICIRYNINCCCCCSAFRKQFTIYGTSQYTIRDSNCNCCAHQLTVCVFSCMPTYDGMHNSICSGNKCVCRFHWALRRHSFFSMRLCAHVNRRVCRAPNVSNVIADSITERRFSSRLALAKIAYQINACVDFRCIQCSSS